MRAIDTNVLVRLIARDLTIQDARTVSAALVTFRKNPKVSFSDCLILESARKAAHLPMGTFDRRLARVEGTQLLPSA